MIISVTGSHSGVGKTTLCSILLREFSALADSHGEKGFGAVKFTKTRLYTSIVDDVKVLSQPGKDTAILLESGAERVIWVKSPVDNLKDVLPIAISRMSDLKGVIVEGNSPVDFLNPDLVIFITDVGGETKPSALRVREKADIFIINSKESEIRSKRVILNSTCKKITTFWIDLSASADSPEAEQNRRGEINEFLSFIKERIKDLY